MQAKRKRRLIYIVVLILGVSVASGLVLYAMNQNINLYLTPEQVVKGKIPVGKTFRLGGLVANNSLNRIKNTLQVNFIVTDLQANVDVQYTGVLPALFHQGRGVVAEGQLNAKRIFMASRILAKHDENYKPPLPGQVPHPKTIIDDLK